MSRSLLKMNDIFLVFSIIFIVLFFVTIKNFLFPNKNTFYNFNSDILKATSRGKRPKEIKDDKTFLGKSGKRGVYVPSSAKHIFTVGTTRSGKTVAVANFIKSGIDYDYPLLIVDGKGDVNNDSMIDIVRKLYEKRENRDKKLYIINMNDPLNSAKYNPFKNTSPTVIKDMLINLTTWTEEHYKLNTERYLQRLIDLLLKADISTSLKNIIAFIEPVKFTSLSAESLTKGIIFEYAAYG